MPYENMSPAITRPTAQDHFALLYVGVCNRQRYVESLIRWTNLLHVMYGYPLGNIRILVGTYSNPSWASMVAGTDVTYDATRTDLDDTLAAYAAGSGDAHELGANDKLFIFTFNHGGQDTSGSYLCCDNFSDKYHASDFATRIGAMQCRQIVLLAAQCNAGGFVEPFINGLWTGTQGSVLAGSRSDQNTYEAVFDKLCASALNGRMVQDALDDNIDLGITGDGVDVTLIPGYHTNRIDWGPHGVMSTREAFNWVVDHYINEVRPTQPQITEIPLYDQKPWIAAGKPVHIRLGEPDLVMQDCSADPGVEPSSCPSPWHSPDIFPDNTDQFPGTTANEYVPAHDNRFFVRSANRGTAPTDAVWRMMEVRGLGFTGGPVGPPRIDRAIEASGGVDVSARIRPGRAHTQFERIMIGGDFGHGCVSAASWAGADDLSHNLWSIVADNDQAQCNLNPATVSGSVPVSSGSVNSNAGSIVQVIPVVAERGGTFSVKIGKVDAGFELNTKLKDRSMKLRKRQRGEFVLTVSIPPRTKDGGLARLPVTIYRNDDPIGGLTFVITVATAHAHAFVHDTRGLAVPTVEVSLRHPGDPRVLVAKANRKGIAAFGPLNPGFYFASVKGSEPQRVHITARKDNRILLCMERKRKG